MVRAATRIHPPGFNPGWLPGSSSDRVILVVAGVVFLISGWMLFFYPFGLDWEADAPVVASVRTDGKIRRRHARVLQWEDLTAATDIYLRDILYVPPGASAEVVLKDGKTVRLDSESLVQFDDITISEIEISLFDKVKKREREKVFRILPLPKPPKAGYLPDTSGFTLLHQELAQRVQQRLAKHPTLLTVKSISRPPRFSLNRLEDFDIRLVSPADDAKIALNGERWMQMEWSPVPLVGVQYEILMSRDPKFKQQIPHATQSTSVNVQFQDPGMYYWRVRVRRAGESVISVRGAFEMVAPKGSRQPGSAIAPSNGIRR